MVDGDLYRMDPATLRISRLTERARISDVDAVAVGAEDLVVVPNDRRVGDSRIERFLNGGFEPLPGLGVLQAEGGASLWPTGGGLVYSRVQRLPNSLPRAEEILVADFQTGRSKSVLQVPTDLLGPRGLGLAAGPGGRLAISNADPRREAVRVLGPGEQGAWVDAPRGFELLGSPKWGAGPRLAFSVITAGYGEKAADEFATVIADPDTREATVLRGWIPLDWAPDGARLLLKKMGPMRRLRVSDRGFPGPTPPWALRPTVGVVVSPFRAVREIGEVGVSFANLAWVR
ncbi:MAG: hypothetical protein HY775_04930 [Acidobacteria bacterium]|nr:hypothetical protein [Acidobacteriota bacterium]